MANRSTRVSLIDYVNAWPLTWGFLQGVVEDVDLITDTPAECADRLRRGEVDAGLVPSVEAGRIPGLRIVRGLGIAAREEVRSVVLASKVPVGDIRSVAVDSSSRSSAAMLRVLLLDLFATSPGLHASVPDLGEMLAHHDAALLIGDLALTADLSGLHVVDLAGAWRKLTDLPFVFAVWAVRPGVPPEPFLWSRDFARRHSAELLRAASARTGVAEGPLRDYLDGALHHDLGTEDEEGLAEFFRRAAGHGLIPSPDVPPFAGVPLVPSRQS
jgi:chorismate dehydratase